MKTAIILSISLIICTLLSTASCSVAGLGSPSIETPVISVPFSPDIVTISSDPNEVVVAAYKKFYTVRSYRCHQEMTMLKGLMIKGELEFVAPDRRRRVQQSENGKVEMIIIGKDLYMGADGKWSKMPIDAPDYTEIYNPQEIDRAMGEVKTKFQYEVVGPDTIDGTPVIEYQTKPGGAKTSGVTSKIWVGTKDNLIYKTEVETDSDYGGNPHKNRVTDIYYDYNADIKIEPPM